MKHYIIALAAAMAIPAAAQAQEAVSSAGAQAIAIAGGAGGGGGSRFSGVATTPDAIAPSSSTAIGGRSCVVPATSDSVSLVFISYGGARWTLDEGCEARADAEMHVTIAYARMELFGDEPGALRNVDLAERRMAATRDDYRTAWADLARPWKELEWRP